MRIWLDAHLPPGVCPWLEAQFGVTAEPVRDLGLRHAKDSEIFFAARSADAVVMTKDHDFTLLLQEVLAVTLAAAIELLEGGERLVEISCRR